MEYNMLGYAPLWRKVCNSVYAVYAVNETGDPLVVTKISNRNGKKVELIKYYFGSAFAVSADGLFLTASHVLDDLRNTHEKGSYKIGLYCIPGYGMPNNMLFLDEIVKEWSKDKQDIALIRCKVDKPIEFLGVRTGGALEAPGQPVAAFGYPLNEMEKDMIKALQRTTGGVISAIPLYNGIISYEVDTLFNHGLSGGPLLSIRREDVIGVVNGTLFSGNGRYPIQISTARIPTHINKYEYSIGEELEKLGVPKNHFK